MITIKEIAQICNVSPSTVSKVIKNYPTIPEETKKKVRKVIEEELHLNIPIAGLAKDAHHRTSELLYGNPPVIIGLDIKSALFNFLTRIQDEVHRYAITFHREKRSKHQIASELNNIKGIGEKSKEALLKKLHSVKRIREASEADLEAIVGGAKAKIIRDYFDSKQ